jgi:peptidoglycan/LPS O-acetylase OafA/YrhL
VLIECKSDISTNHAQKPDPRKLSIGAFQSDLLDLSRWGAAFLVVTGHVRSFMFRPYETQAHVSALEKAFYFMTGFGHSAVMVFFVMSGFLVGGKVLERLALGTFSWRKYATDRGSRIYAVYAAALLLGAALDYFGYHDANRFGLYDLTFPGTLFVVDHNFHASLTPAVFGVNLIMCQTIFGPVLGSNGPLWSLANEFWYYVLGAILFAMFYANRPWQAVLCVCAITAIYLFLPISILAYFLIWLMGASLYYLRHKPILPLWFSLLLFLGCCGVERLQMINRPYVTDFSIGLSFALVINSCSGINWRIPGHLLSRKAADFSYSAYLCHFPFVVFLLSFVYQKFGFGLQGSGGSRLLVCLFLAVVGCAYVWCYLVSLLTERQTPRIRKFVNRFSSGAALLQSPRRVN